MKLEIKPVTIIKGSPTSICYGLDRIYISTKGTRLFYLPENVVVPNRRVDIKDIKSIKFANQVNSLCSDGMIMYCAQKDGTIFGINSKCKSVYKSFVNSEPSLLMFSNDIYVATKNHKLMMLGTNSLLKNTFFLNDTPINHFDVSNGRVAVSQENSQTLSIFKDNVKETIKVSDGFPEVLKYLETEIIMLGTTKGVLSVFSTVTKKRLFSLKLDGSITAIYLISSTCLIVGTASSKIYLINVLDFYKMEILQEVDVGGIPIGFSLGDKGLYAALSRESRLGRWHRNINSRNQLVLIIYDHK